MHSAVPHHHHHHHHHTIHAGTHTASLLLPRQQRHRLATPLCASSQQSHADDSSGPSRRQHEDSNAPGGQHGDTAAGAANNMKDAPDRTYRRRAQKQRDRRTDGSGKVPIPVANDSPQQPPPALNYVAGVDEPQLLPGLISFPPSSTSPAGAALQQLVEGTQDPEEKEQLLRMLEEQYDQQLMAQLQDMPAEDRARLIEAALAPENDIGWWEQQLLMPVMQDQLREELGPELSELMDLLLGQPPYRPQGSSSSAPQPEQARKRRDRRLRLNQPAREQPPKLAYDPNVLWQAPEGESKATLRKRLMRLTPEQKARLPELFVKLQQLDRTYDTAGQVVDMYEAVQARGQQLKYLRLARRARAKGLALPDPPQTQQDMLQPLDADATLDEDVDVDSSSGTQGGGAAIPVAGKQPAAAQEHEQLHGALDTEAGPVSQSGKLQRVRQVLEARGHLQAAIEQPVTVAGDVTQAVSSASSAQGQRSSAATIDAGGPAAGVGEHLPASSYQEEEQSGTSGSVTGSRHIAGDVVSADEQGRNTAMDSESLRQTALNAGLSAEVADLVSRLNALYERFNPQTGTGWEEGGYTGSSEMQCLKRAALTLAGAARITSQEELQAMGLTADELSLHMTSAMNDIMALLEMEAAAGAQGLPEPAVHACLLYLRTQLLQPEQQPAGKDTGDDDDTSGQPVMTLPVDRETTDRLLRIIAASEVWEALHSLAASWGTSRKDRNLLAGMLYNMSRLGQGDPAWWAKEYNDMTAAEQSMVLRKQLEARIREREGILGPIDGAQRDKQQQQEDPMAGLLSTQWLREAILIADEERITAMASLDSGVLCCLQELEEQNYADEVLMKWSLHPVVGPRLTAGLPLMDLNTVHPWFQDVLAEAQNYAADGLDFEWRMMPKGHPMAQQVLARQHRRQGSSGSSSKAKSGGMAGLPKRVRSKLSKNTASASSGSQSSSQ